MNRRHALSMLAAVPAAVALPALPARALHWTDIPARLGATPGLSTLNSALEASGLMAGLRVKTASYTLFAPTNEAFAALPAGTLDDLLRPENQSALENVLRGHLVLGRVRSDQFLGRRVQITMANGSRIRVDGTRSPAVVNNRARLLGMDDEGRNGIIHVIDAVILPG